VFSTADYHIQTEPVCRPCRADLTSSPVSRKPRTPASRIRKLLGLGSQARIVLVTAGGIPSRFPSLEGISGSQGVFFLVPSAGKKVEVRGSVILLPHRSEFFHPDLVNAADAVVGKAGYSTLAEVYWAGVPFGYVSRQGFREAEALAAFIDHRMASMAITEQALTDGSWISKVPELLAMQHRRPGGVNGADQIAAAILQVLSV
jgi:UDP-N-acetylglucosamine:LPS N-acetylglucosamine transferase